MFSEMAKVLIVSKFFLRYGKTFEPLSPCLCEYAIGNGQNPVILGDKTAKDLRLKSETRVLK